MVHGQKVAVEWTIFQPNIKNLVPRCDLLATAISPHQIAILGGTNASGNLGDVVMYDVND